MKKLWSDAEIEILISYYPTVEINALQKILGRSKSSIHDKAWTLGLHKINRSQFQITINGQKQCKQCNLWKSTDEFYSAKNTITKFSSWCRECKNISTVMYVFNIDKTEYNVLHLLEVCSICGELEPDIVRGKRRKMSIDHNHSCCPGKKSCGKCIRGLLCTKCNTGLGAFKENPILLKAAINYLREKEKQYL